MRTERADRAQKRKTENFVRRGTWELILEEYVPPVSNLISGSFLIAVKDVGTDRRLFKARSIAQGHRNSEKHNLVHNSTNVRQSSVRLLIAFAAIMGFNLCT